MDKRVPLVSVILPCYNCEQTIREAIDSIIDQTYSNWKLIVCDDGSTDGTYAILQQYKEQLGDQMILLQNEKNSKIATTLNHCLAYAEGKYIARMDSDDRCRPLRFEKQVQYLEEHADVDCVGTGVEVFDEHGIRGQRYIDQYPVKDTIFKKVPFAHPTIMMKAEAYQLLDGYRVCRETLRAEDVDLWFRFWEKGLKGYNIQEILLDYRERCCDYCKRNMKAARGISKIKFHYLIKNRYSIRNVYYCIRSLLIAALPPKVVFLYHNRKLNR